MTNAKQFLLGKSRELILYILGFVLFWEWLRPLEQVTDTAKSIYFVYFVAFCFLLYFLHLPLWLSFPLRLVGTLYILHTLFFKGSFIRTEWLEQLFDDFRSNLQLIFDLKWLEITDLFRTFLFLLLLWVLCYLLHYWLMEVKQIFSFFVLTILYVTVLDTFTPYDATIAIVRTAIVGIVILGCLQFSKIRKTEGVPIRPYWMILLSLMLAFSVGIGYLAPKFGPQWPDPVPFIKSVAIGNYTTTNKIGYGLDDSRLGGAFTDDDTTVFTAEVKKVHYWRVETKDFYTGKGWEVSKDFSKILLDKNNIQLDLLENVDTEKGIKENVTFENMGEHPHIPYPIDLRKITFPEDANLFVSPFTGKLSIEEVETYPPNRYELTYNYPKFSKEALLLANSGDNNYLKEIYTQLPDNLPERVKTLAAEITKNQSTRYEKVKAIESYFSKQGYVYEKRNVAIPQEGQDYVDQFLFETKKGYCDNFSTSMVVLLRSLEVPSRWVKGYTQGQYKKSTSTGTKIYEVKNSNAHSWVEVYFPGIGWVPFEPTRGFRSPYQFTENVVPASLQVDEQQQKQKEQMNTANNNAKSSKNDKKEKRTSTNPSKAIKLPVKEVAIAIGIIAVLIWLLRKFRSKWLPYWTLAQYRLRRKQQTPEQSFEILFKLLNNKGLPIYSGETIREYAIRVDKTLGTSEMQEIIGYYEKMVYSNGAGNEEWAIVKTVWESLIKKILA